MPVSVNSCYRSASINGKAMTYMTKKGKEYKQKIRNKIQGVEKLEGNLKEEIYLVFPDHKRRDVGNFEKIINDAMEGICFKDDTQITELFIKKIIKSGMSGIKVKIKEV